MTDDETLEVAIVWEIAHAAGLDLSEDRLRAVASALSEFRAAFDPLWDLDLGDRDPAVLTFPSEVNT